MKNIGTSDIKGKPQIATIKKYEECLKAAIRIISVKDAKFIATDFKKENKLPGRFFEIAKELGYIDILKDKGKISRYVPLKNSMEISESDGRRIAEASLAYNYKHVENVPSYLRVKEAPEPNPVKQFPKVSESAYYTAQKKEVDIHEFSRIELESELERRGVIKPEPKTTKDFTDEELVAELKSRGFSGMLEKKFDL